jgi:hypothetical protein
MMMNVERSGLEVEGLLIRNSMGSIAAGDARR